MRSRYIAEHSFVSCRNDDVFDDSAYGFHYSMGVGKNVCKVCDHYDDEKAEFQYGPRPQFPKDDINPSYLYCVCFGGEEFRSWHFDDFGRVLGLILVLSEIVIREICRCFSRPFLFAVPFCCLPFGLYSWEGRGGGAVVHLTLCLYVASLVPLGGKEGLCDDVSSVWALSPVVCRICWRFLERCLCVLRVLGLACGFVVSQHLGGGAVGLLRLQSFYNGT